MAKEIVVVTTKPAENIAEYGIRDSETGEWLIHGLVIPLEFEALTLDEKVKLNNARSVMQSRALADASAKGFSRG